MTETIVLLHHPGENEKREANQFRAILQRTVARTYSIWMSADISAYGSATDQEQEAIQTAKAVIVMIGKAGLDTSFVNLTQAMVNQQIAKRGSKFGRILVLTGPAKAPSSLEPWPRIEDVTDFDEAARQLADQLEIEVRRPAKVRLDAGMQVLEEANAGKLATLLREFTNAIVGGNQLAIFVGPHAHVSGDNDPSCPSYIRLALTKLIDDVELRKSLSARKLAKGKEEPPLLWQDHLATLCLASRGAINIDMEINKIVEAAEGDAEGEPPPFFNELGRLARGLKDYHGNRRGDAGVPALTLISLCPGLRIERALIAHGVPFERVSLRFTETEALIDDRRFEPNDDESENARLGSSDPFMPRDQDPTENWHGVTLVKLGGSRDLSGQMPSDISRVAVMLSMGDRLDKLLRGAAGGAYLALGGGLLTPMAQGVHAALLRRFLEGRQRFPRYAIVPAESAGRDPLANAEARQLASQGRIPGCGFGPLTAASGPPRSFLAALNATFAQETLQ